MPTEPATREDFARLYAEHLDRLRAAAWRLTRSHDRTEDLVAEAFARAFEKFASFRGESAFGTWLHRILLNLVYDSTERATEEVSESLRASRGCEPDARFEARHAAARIDEALGRLSRSQREVFLMKELEGRKHAEIAARLGIAENTSKVHYFHAVKRLREELHDLV